MHNNYGNLNVNFVDLGTEDVHLKFTSQAIDAGVSISDNIWGSIRYSGSAPDLGAFENWEIGGIVDNPPVAPTGLRIVN
jgi:hypothetical protein